MSSHHIVREKQEPALLVIGIERFSEELLGQLLEWSPTVIVTQETAEKVHAFGTKIDWLIGHEEMQDLQSDVKYLPAGNNTLTEAALKYLVAHNYPAVNVVTDHVDLKDFLLFIDKITLVIFTPEHKIFSVPSGFSKWKPQGEKIRIITHPTGLQASGLEPIAEHTYQTTHDGFYTLQFGQPFVFIAEEL